MIRGLGVYTPDSAEAVGDGSPQAAVDATTHPTSAEATIRELRDRASAAPGGFVWVGLFEPSRDEIDLIAQVFQLPHLLVEDAANPHQRPKFEFDDAGHGLALLKVLDYVDSTSDVRTGQLAVFVGPSFAVTVRFGEIGDLRGVRDRLAGSTTLRQEGPLAVLYAVLDHVVDGYLAIADEVSFDVENLEAEVFAQVRASGTANSIYLLKRENIEMRRAVGPLVTWAHDAVDERLTWVPEDLQTYFRDIGEHVLRANDAVESTDNLLMTMLMASTSLQDLQQNKDMRKISAWVAIAAVPTAVAAIYGMNFDYMPELDQPWGYPAILGIMAGSCLLLFRAFKRSGWL